jgi:uncharacterized membrane protein YraQ (UPF0718 family)
VQTRPCTAALPCSEPARCVSCRANPLQTDALMNQPRRNIPLIDGMTLIFMAVAVVSGTALWAIHGRGKLVSAAGDAGLLLLLVLPIVVTAVLMGAYVQRLVTPALARRWVGRESGFRGLLLATVAGTLTPGGPFAAFPLVVGLYHAGASLAVCVTYVTAWGVLGLQRVFVWEIAFFGAEFVLLRLLVSLPLPFIAGYLTLALFRERRRD